MLTLIVTGDLQIRAANEGCSGQMPPSMMPTMMFSPILVGFQFKYLFNDAVGLVNNALFDLGLITAPMGGDYWLFDPAADIDMIGTAENLARRYGVFREEADAYALRSFELALAAQNEGVFAGEIVSVHSESFALDAGCRLWRDFPVRCWRTARVLRWPAAPAGSGSAR